ncbi:MAG: diheme cytochrome c [Gallionella sp.]
MLNNYRSYRWSLAIKLFVGVALMMNIAMTTAQADEDGGRLKSSKRPQVSNAKWKDECGSCHIAYPPRFLRAESWRAVMSGLDKHFGSDASVDAETASEISKFLVTNASNKARKSADGKEPPLRITDTRWFQSEHRKEKAYVGKDRRVKSLADCGGCHSYAASGSFAEGDIRMPK